MRTKTDKLNRLHKLLPLLACPVCRGPLQWKNDAALSSSCGAEYLVSDGVPILLPPEMVAEGLGNELGVGEDVSMHPYSTASEAIINEHQSGWVLDLGAGGKLVAHSNVIQMDVFRFPMTDVVGSADCLPFRGHVFNAVVSQAVFEHLQFPDVAAAEIWRVLKHGGVAKIDTAFLQPEHAYPHHYFNATEAGLRHWFRDFDLDWSGVESYQHPKWALAWFIADYFAALPDEARKVVELLPLGECLDALSRVSRGVSTPEDALVSAALDALVDSKVRTLAAGVSVRAVKRTSGNHVSRDRDAGSNTTVQSLERKLEARTSGSHDHQDFLLSRTEVALVEDDRARFLLHEYMLMRKDPVVNPGFIKPLLNLVAREIRRYVSQDWWVYLNKIYRSVNSMTVHNENLATVECAIIFAVEPGDEINLLDQFFSLTHQTHADWSFWIYEPKQVSAQMQRLMWELTNLDNRVKVIKQIKSNNFLPSVPWIRLKPDAMLSFDAVEELVTLIQHQPCVSYVTADVESRSSNVQQPMRCWSWRGNDSCSSDKVINSILDADFFIANCPGDLPLSINITSVSDKVNKFVHIPKVLYRLR